MQRGIFLISFELYYSQLVILITVIWITLRVVVAIKNKGVNVKRELQLLPVYCCILLIARFVYFPMETEDGHVFPLKFNSGKVWPFWINWKPIEHMFDEYDEWLINIIGNVAMFIPVGIVWPFCFQKLDRIWKTVLAGFLLSLFIEISQLLFYQRISDVDDLIMNTTGALIGALIYFGVRRLKRRLGEAP